MTRKDIIEKTVNAINRLPDDKAEEILNFADLIIKKYEEKNLAKNIMHLSSTSHALNFLNEEEELYSSDDLKEKYNG